MKKNKRMIIIVSTLLLLVGVSFSYYVGKLLTEGNGASTKVTTASLNNSTVTVEGNLEMNNPDMLPGHKVVAKIKVTATGNNELIPYNLIWKGINGLTKLKYEVYKPGKEVESKAECEKLNKNISGGIALYEECKITNYEELGTKISSGEINKSETEEKVILKADELITSSKEGTEEYYYVILEFPNENSNQNIDKNKNFSGKILVEASTTEPDINIVATFIEDKETKKYNQTNEIPGKEDGYILDTKNSTCTNESNISWDDENWGILIKNYNKPNTNCKLYFKIKLTAEDTLANLNIKPNEDKLDINNLIGPSCVEDTCVSNASVRSMKQNGVYEVKDQDGNPTYVYRGTVNNNWVKFGGFWWRIIRINGNGSLRIIYSGIVNGGEMPSLMGETTQIEGTIAFNSANDNNKYVGFRYKDGKRQGNEEPSTILGSDTDPANGTLNKWYNDNIKGKGLEEYIEKDEIFCNDRRSSSPNASTFLGRNNKGGTGSTTTYYGAYLRVHDGSSWSKNQQATLTCDEEDEFSSADSNVGNRKLSKPVGLITVDEALIAGGFGGQANNGYWLYTGKEYWTMSPSYYSSSGSVFYVISTGNIGSNYVSYEYYGVRPVINISADVEFKDDSDGTIAHPYEVITE